jgi:hypothetical protein
MNDQDAARIIRLLEEIRDGQRLQLERQAQALERQSELMSLQRDRLAGLSKAANGVSNLQTDAQQMLAKSAKVVAGARTLMFIALPLVGLLLLFVIWVLFAHVMAR